MSGTLSDLKKRCLKQVKMAFDGMLEMFAENDFKVVDTIRGKTKDAEGFLGKCQFLSGVFQAITVLSQYKIDFKLQPDISSKILSILSDVNNEFKEAMVKFNPALLNAMPYADIEEGLSEANESSNPKTLYFTESLAWCLSVFTLARHIILRASDKLDFDDKLKQGITENLMQCLTVVSDYQTTSGWGWSRNVAPSIYYTYTILNSIDDLADYVFNESDLQDFKTDNELIKLYKKKTKQDLKLTIDQLRDKAKYYIRSTDNLLEPELAEPSKESINNIYERLYILSSIYFSGTDTAISEKETEAKQEHYAKKINPIYQEIIKFSSNDEYKDIWDSESDYTLSLTNPIPSEDIKQFNNMCDPGILCLLINASTFFARITEQEILSIEQLKKIQEILTQDAKISNSRMYWYYPGYTKNRTPYCLWYTVSSIEALISIIDWIELLPKGDKGFDADSLSKEAIDKLLSNENIKNHIKDRFFSTLFSGSHITAQSTRQLPISSDKKLPGVTVDTYPTMVIDEIYEIFDDIYNIVEDGGEAQNIKITTCKDNLTNLVIKIVAKNFDKIILEYANHIAPSLQDEEKELYQKTAISFSEDFKDTIRKILTNKDAFGDLFSLKKLLDHLTVQLIDKDGS